MRREAERQMRVEAIERPRWGPGSCNFFGLHFSEQFVKGMDAILIVYFCYMLVYEASEYRKYQSETDCVKPFGLFWIGHFLSIVSFRVFHYLEKYFLYRLALVFFDNDTTTLSRARCWAIAMKLMKLSSFLGFVIFTFIGSVWFVEDGKCLRDYAEVKMAFWLFLSFAVCLIYMIRTLTKLMYEPQQLVQADDNRNFRIFMWADNERKEGGRNLTSREIVEIKRAKLCSYTELRRSKNRTQWTEMSTISSVEPVPATGDDTVVTNPEVKEDEDQQYNRTCAVCLDDIEIGDWFKKLPQCEHCFHGDCIDQWLKTRATCPVCREEIFSFDSSLRQADEENPAARRIRREIRIGSGNSSREPRVVLRFTR